MSSVTLETLKADYEAARALADHHPGLVQDREVGGLEHLRRKLELRAEAREKGALYVVARDYGMRAATLYKLSDGRFDPREP